MVSWIYRCRKIIATCTYHTLIYSPPYPLHLRIRIVIKFQVLNKLDSFFRSLTNLTRKNDSLTFFSKYFFRHRCLASVNIIRTYNFHLPDKIVSLHRNSQILPQDKWNFEKSKWWISRLPSVEIQSERWLCCVPKIYSDGSSRSSLCIRVYWVYFSHSIMVVLVLTSCSLLVWQLTTNVRILKSVVFFLKFSTSKSWKIQT